jgi:hypothetical protein
LAKDESTSNSKPLAAWKSHALYETTYDPVTKKILSLNEADQAIVM